MKVYLIVMLLGNPTHITWTEMPSVKACEIQKTTVYNKAIEKGESILVKCEIKHGK